MHTKIYLKHDLFNFTSRFNSVISNLLDSIDNVAKETLEEPKVSATSIRMRRRGEEEDDTVDGGEPPENVNDLTENSSECEEVHIGSFAIGQGDMEGQSTGDYISPPPPHPPTKIQTKFFSRIRPALIRMEENRAEESKGKYLLVGCCSIF